MYSSRGRAVAMLVFLARAARTGLVAPDLAIGRLLLRRFADKRFGGIRAGSAENRLDDLRNGGAGGSKRSVDCAAQIRRWSIIPGNLDRIHRRRPFEGDFDAAQLRRRRLPQMFDQFAEKLEGLCLIFVQGVALGHTAPADNLAQMIERHEMLAPQMVESLQNDL